jgi:hypothetical protein
VIEAVEQAGYELVKEGRMSTNLLLSIRLFIPILPIEKK